jgi:hypothetical protein
MADSRIATEVSPGFALVISTWESDVSRLADTVEPSGQHGNDQVTFNRGCLVEGYHDGLLTLHASARVQIHRYLPRDVISLSSPD